MLFAAAMEEWAAPRASAGSGRALLERIEKVMTLSLDREIDALARHLSSLATIGATAPFVGLFGTVWGIMNSFQSIALTKNTTLAVVAPGIAEALLATALGLVAAIPAVSPTTSCPEHRSLRQSRGQLRRRVHRGSLARAGWPA